MGGHLARVGRNLGQATSAYNAAMGSLESRVLVSARKLKELEAGGGGDTEIELLEPVAEMPRRLTAPELVPAAAEDDDPVAGRATAR
jgi:DNA recombination protein RmuC